MAQHEVLDPATPSTGPLERNGFAARLRDATKTVHREAERTGFIADLLRGRATREGYALFLRNLVPVYATMEARIAERRDVPLVAVFAAPGLPRLAALEADLAAIAGPDWAQAHAILWEAQGYAAAIARAAGADGLRLASHAYARYLGDLSGGQILRGLLARSLGLDDAALRFYDFSVLGDIEAQKAAIRHAFDQVPVAGEDADTIVRGAIGAFQQNIDLSLAVSRALAG